MIRDKRQEFATNVVVQWSRLYTMLAFVLCTTGFGGHADKVATSVYTVNKALYYLPMCVGFSSIFGSGETESIWYVGHKLAYCTRPG
jgi:hypothetical protein